MEDGNGEEKKIKRSISKDLIDYVSREECEIR